MVPLAFNHALSVVFRNVIRFLLYSGMSFIICTSKNQSDFMLREQGALQLFCLFMICSLPLRAQILDTTKVPAPVIHTDIQKLNPKPLPQDKKITLRSFYLPAGLITYGIVTLGSDGLRQFNHKVREEVYQQDPEKKLGVDDYLQYAPAVAVYGLNFVGVKGLHNFRDRTIIYLMSDIVLNAVVNCGKKLTRELRPDGSNYLSFPSGHTAHAFASAEFLRREYRHLSPWYGIAGYAVAISTGYLRMYNNR